MLLAATILLPCLLAFLPYALERLCVPPAAVAGRRPTALPARSVAMLTLVTALAVAGCSRQETAWRSAQSQDTVVAYETYLRDYPAGPHIAAARSRLVVLREQQEWDRALRFDTPEAFQRYLSGYPDGRFAAAARERLADFLLARAPAGDAEPPPGARGTLLEAAGASDARIQLGAFSGGEAAARQAWTGLLDRHGDLLSALSPHIDVVERNGTRLWRLQAGPLSEAGAREACRVLVAREEACLVARQ